MSTKRIKSDKFTDGEINEEINARAAILAQDALKSVVHFRHPLSRHRTPTILEGESMTHQSHAESCDINNIIRQFDRTGLLPPQTREPMYADVSNLNKPLSELVSEAAQTQQQFNTDVQTHVSKKTAALAAEKAAAIAAAQTNPQPSPSSTTPSSPPSTT